VPQRECGLSFYQGPLFLARCRLLPFFSRFPDSFFFFPRALCPGRCDIVKLASGPRLFFPSPVPRFIRGLLRRSDTFSPPRFFFLPLLNSLPPADAFFSPSTFHKGRRVFSRKSLGSSFLHHHLLVFSLVRRAKPSFLSLSTAPAGAYPSPGRSFLFLNRFSPLLVS